MHTTVRNPIGRRISRPRWDRAHTGRLCARLKLAALLVFGALISPGFLAETRPSGYVFAFLVPVLVRPSALGVDLLGSRLNWRE
jgi:hypothetical protein